MRLQLHEEHGAEKAVGAYLRKLVRMPANKIITLRQRIYGHEIQAPLCVQAGDIEWLIYLNPEWQSFPLSTVSFHVEEDVEPYTCFLNSLYHFLDVV